MCVHQPDEAPSGLAEELTPWGNAANENRLQRLGECLGKGAFGSVYKAFNWGTGEAVAVKQIKLADLPKSELRMIEVWTATDSVSKSDLWTLTLPVRNRSFEELARRCF